MRKAIGTILLIFWMLLASLLVLEPDPNIPEQTWGDWVGIVYLILLFGLPFVWGNLLKETK